MEGIYKIENIINGKLYIGSSVNIDKRIKRHKNDLIKNKHINCYLQREFNKYGIHSYIFECVELCNSDNLKILEQKYLDDIFSSEKYNEKYYNISKDASGGDNLSNNPNRLKIIDKIKKTLIERYQSEPSEDRDKRVENLTGEKNPNYGNRWDDVKRNKMSKQRKGINSKIKGKTYEEIHGEYKANILKKNHSKKMKGNLIGDKNPFFGKKHSKENINFFSESQKYKPNKGILSRFKPFYIDDKIFYTLNKASKELHINYLTIRYRLNSKKFKNYFYIEDLQIIDILKVEYLNQDFI